MNGGLLQAEDLSDIMITDTKIIITGGEFRIRQPFQADPNDPNSLWGLSEADMQNLIDIGTIEVTGVYSIITDGDYTALMKDASLVAYYPLDEGSGNIAADASGNGHDGAILGTPTWIDSMSGYGTALYFAGSNPADGYVDCGTWNPSEGTGQLTVALWARYDGLVEGWQRIIGKRDGWAVDNMMWQIEINKNNQQISFERTDVYPVGGGIVLPEGQWAHVAVTFDGTTAVFYVNGEETGRGDFSFGTKTDSALIIGADNPEGWNSFHGALDEVMLYNRALSEAEVLELASK